MPIKIAVTDDHPLVTEGICNILKNVDDIEIIAVHTSGLGLLEGLKLELPDVLLLDMQLPDISGSVLVPIIRKLYPNLAILIVSGLDALALVKSMIQLGCQGYLLKSTANKKTLTEAIEKVFHTRDLYIDPLLKEYFVSEALHVKKKATGEIKLSRREKEILELVVEEYSNPEIAKKLCLSLRTVENHKYNLFQKLEVKNSVALIKTVLQRGLLQ